MPRNIIMEVGIEDFIEKLLRQSLRDQSEEIVGALNLVIIQTVGELQISDTQAFASFLDGELGFSSSNSLSRTAGQLYTQGNEFGPYLRMLGRNLGKAGWKEPNITTLLNIFVNGARERDGELQRETGKGLLASLSESTEDGTRFED